MSAFTALPLDQQPRWLAQYHAVVRAYAAGRFYVLECRWCSAGWTLPRDYRPETHAVAMLDVAAHGMAHAAAGEMRLDAAGEPIDSDDDGDDGEEANREWLR